jgi:hypothetical protein
LEASSVAHSAYVKAVQDISLRIGMHQENDAQSLAVQGKANTKNQAV